MQTHYKLLLIVLFGVVLACQMIEPSPTSSPSEPSDTVSSLMFSPSELPEAQVGQPYQATITITGNETPVFSIVIDSGELPPGLKLVYEEVDDTAKIEGTPEEAGEFEFTVHAYCFGTNVSGQTGEQHYKLVVRQE